MRNSRSTALPLLVAFCGALSLALVFWSQHQPAPETGLAPGEPAISGEVQDDKPVGPLEPPAPSGEPNPSEAPSSDPAIVPGEKISGEPEAPAAADSAPQTPEGAGTLPGSAPSEPPASADAEKLDLHTLAREAALWPQQVTLLAPARFPVFINGQEAGNVQVPAGSVVGLRKVREDGQVELERQGSLATVPAEATDLLSRAQKLKALREAGTVQAAPASSSVPPAASPAAPDEPASPPDAPAPSESALLQISVKRDRRTEAGPDGKARKTWQFQIDLTNRTAKYLPVVQGRFFVFSRTEDGVLMLAASEKVTTDLPPNGEVTLKPEPLILDDRTPFDGYALILRDGAGAIVGTASTRESATRDWKALEEMQPGTPLPPRN